VHQTIVYKCDARHSDSANKSVDGIVSTQQENPMSDLVARSRKIYFPTLSTSITVVFLFCLLGLAIAAAIVPMIPPKDINWVLSHIE
jgi:hypothetical protein